MSIESIVPVETPTQAWPEMRTRAEALVSERPDDPARVALVMHYCEGLLLEVADLLARINNDRYDAQRAYSSRRAAAIAKHGQHYAVTIARAIADQEAEPERRAWDAQRALFHHVEDVQTALKQKHFGLMNINKNMQSVMFERGRQQ